MKSKIFIMETDWMINLFQKQYAKCRVFAFIYGLTHNGRGWEGDYRRLAKVLCISDEGVRKMLIELRQAGLIQELNGVITTCYEPANSTSEPANSVGESDNSLGEPTNNVDESTNYVAKNTNSIGSLPPTPPITNNIIKEKENNCAREQHATQETPSLLSFDYVLNLYEENTGIKNCQDAINTAKRLWEASHICKKKRFIRLLKSGDFFNYDRIDWDFKAFKVEPPINYNEHDLPKNIPLVRAKFNGTGGVFSLEDAKDFEMDIKGDFTP